MMNISMVDSLQRASHRSAQIAAAARRRRSTPSAPAPARAEPGRFRRRRIAAVERHHDAGQQDHERQHARQQARPCRQASVVFDSQQCRLARRRASSNVRAALILAPVAPAGIAGKQHDQQQPGADAARNRRPSDCSAATAYRIMVMDGGSRMPRVPPAAMMPAAKPRE